MVIVPEMPGGCNDEPLDLGTLEPVMVHAPQIGEAAPLLEVKTEDGGTFKLADHWGQYVLLDFEPLNSIYQDNQSVEVAWTTFGKNDRLAMLTLQVPPTTSYMNGPYKECPWPHEPVGEFALVRAEIVARQFRSPVRS